MKPTPAKIVIGGISVEEVSGIEAEVCLDIAKRQARGKRKYPTELALNRAELRAHLQAVYEETFSYAVYLKRTIKELEAENQCHRR